MEQRAKGFFRDQRVRRTLLASWITAAAAYGYGMTNNIANYDSVYNVTAFTGGEVSGRWALSLLSRAARRLHIGASVPFFNILISVLLLSLAAVLICEVLGLRSGRSWVLTGVVTLSFPAVASMTFFSYTMPYYALAVLLIAGATLLTRRLPKPLCFLVYSLLLAFAVGIYQAFYPFAVMLAVLAMTADCLDPETGPGPLLGKGLLYIAAICLSYLWYRLGLKAVLLVLGQKLTGYQGIDQMGKLELRTLPAILGQMYRHFFLLPGHDYLSLTGEPISRICVLLLFLLSVLLLVLGWREKNPWKIVGTVFLLGLALPVSSNLILLMVPDGTTYTLMALGLLSLFLLPILLWDRLSIPRAGLRRVLGGALAAVLLLSSLEYVYLSNGCYRVLEWHNIQTENYYVTLMTRVKAAEGYDDSFPVLYAGKVIADESYADPWKETVFNYGGLRQFDSEDPCNNGFNEFSRDRFVRSYLGYTVRPLRAEEQKRFASVLAEMSTYPSDGSIRVVDGTVLIKFE